MYVNGLTASSNGLIVGLLTDNVPAGEELT